MFGDDQSEVEIGTVSHGTLRPEDLIPAFMFELERLAPESAAKLATAYSGDGWPYSMDGLSFGEYITDHPEESGWLLESLFDALGEIAPPGCYFGSLEGDGADFGFWNSDQEGNDGNDAYDDMLAALERIASDQTVFELDEEGEGWDVESLASWHEANVNAARAAIAKAKGEPTS